MLLEIDNCNVRIGCVIIEKHPNDVAELVGF